MMMDDEPPPPPPAPIVMQAPAPIQQTAKEAAMGSAEGLKYLVDSGTLPVYAQQQTDIQRTQAPQLAQINLDTQRTYGPQLIQLALDQVKAADPTGFEIRKTLGNKTLEDLNLGGSLSPEERRAAEQQVRSSQVSRGLGTSLSDAIDETAFITGQQFNRDQQRRSNAASFLQGATPQASFAALNSASQTSPVGTQNTSGMASQMIPSTNTLVGLAGQNYGMQSANANAMNNYGMGVASYNQEYSSNPFMTGVGVVGSLAATAAGAF